MSKKKPKKLTGKEDCMDGRHDKVGTAVFLLLLFSLKAPHIRELFSSLGIER